MWPGVSGSVMIVVMCVCRLSEEYVFGCVHVWPGVSG